MPVYLFIVIGATHVEDRDSLEELVLSFCQVDSGIKVRSVGQVALPTKWSWWDKRSICYLIYTVQAHSCASF